MAEYALAVTVHDPEERWLARFSPGLSELSSLYIRMVAACTRATSARTLAALESHDFEVVLSDSGRVGESRRNAVRLLLADPSVNWIHYADLDRLLHWQYNYPHELRRTLALAPGSDYIALGRTERALQTHPQVQILAETLTNAAFSALIGLGAPFDVVAGSFLISRRAGDIIVSLSTDPSGATDLEWPALVFRETGSTPECRRLEGLEFETADYYRVEIQRAGSLAAWISATYDRPAVWAVRTKLALDSIVALQRVLDHPKRLS